MHTVPCMAHHAHTSVLWPGKPSTENTPTTQCCPASWPKISLQKSAKSMPESAQVAAMHDSGQPQMLFKMHCLPCCTGHVQPHLTLSSKTLPMLVGPKISPQKSAKVHHPTHPPWALMMHTVLHMAYHAHTSVPWPGKPSTENAPAMQCCPASQARKNRNSHKKNLMFQIHKIFNYLSYVALAPSNISQIP